ncbi:MAG TPA: electron transfer flavoprotein subunit alpha/FixB family protein [Gemmatimonadales bacterium]|nr:electron transfer flavoprotein subunit alpha/FixB family protein [Gemmatimonadales bacterium]
MTAVLAVLEQREGTLRSVSREVVTGSRHLAGPAGRVDSLVLAAGAVSGLDRLGDFGADAVLVRTHPAFERYAPESAAHVISQAASGNYDAVVLGATATGRDLGARVAAKLRVPLAADVTEVGSDDGSFVVGRPVYGGKAVQTLRVTARPAVISLRPSVFTPVEHPKAGTVDTAPAVGIADAGRVVVVDVKPARAGTLDVSEAAVVVSGGRGLKEPANFALIEELARAFGTTASVGASRAVVDAGWRPHAEQVGQTGKTVSPALYVAVGISGAVQHLAGMRSSKVIVAINQDREAPIFNVADYGIVGDLFEVVPALTAALTRLSR